MSFSGVDYFLVDASLSDEELLVRRSTREFVEARVVPVIKDAYNEGRFPLDLVPELGRMGFFGANLEGYGCAGMSNVEYGLIMQELERADSGLRSFVSVQGALVMYPILTPSAPRSRSSSGSRASPPAKPSAASASPNQTSAPTPAA
jgi:glutaryl-CoA dehydrogenase